MLGAAGYLLSDGAIWATLIVVLVILLLGKIVERLALTLGPAPWRWPMLHRRRMSSAVRLLAVVGLAALLVVVIHALADWLYGR